MLASSWSVLARRPGLFAARPRSIITLPRHGIGPHTAGALQVSRRQGCGHPDRLGWRGFGEGQFLCPSQPERFDACVRHWGLARSVHNSRPIDANRYLEHGADAGDARSGVALPPGRPETGCGVCAGGARWSADRLVEASGAITCEQGPSVLKAGRTRKHSSRGDPQWTGLNSRARLPSDWPGFSLRGFPSRRTGPTWWLDTPDGVGTSAWAGVVDQNPMDLSLYTTAAWTVLSSIQDGVSVTLREPWPLVDGR